MIVATNKGFKVTSEGGKNLSKPNLTSDEAKKRLQQVEYWKHVKKK